MGKYDFSVRRAVLARSKEKPKCVHKSWVDFTTGAKALVSDFCVVLQLALLAFLYAFFAYKFTVFYYISLILTFITAVYVALRESDAQSKISWLMLFLFSFGCGYIVYFLADKRMCYGYDRKRFKEISLRTEKYTPEFDISGLTPAVARDCGYMRTAGGFTPYRGTEVKYFSDARLLFDNMIARLDAAEKFIFLEYFIVADGVLFERLLEALSRKIAQGVEVRFLCDDVGCQGVLSGASKRRLKAAGVRFKVFQPLLSPFNFGLNFRDHRKIVVIDGKTGYVGGCNVADECTNQYRMQGMWKDAGVRLDGAAVDGLSLSFLKQWELATREKCDPARYMAGCVAEGRGSAVVPYTGGPENEEAVCRGVYSSVISGARERLYIMTPYLIPDSGIMAQLAAKAESGVDVRIVLPAVPDYPFIYLVTKNNAERLMKSGIKIYYARNKFVHSKVMLTENCVTVGSVNLDMRAFYQEFDNGIYTDDGGVMADVFADFGSVFSDNEEAVPEKRNLLTDAACAILRIVSPLM